MTVSSRCGPGPHALEAGEHPAAHYIGRDNFTSLGWNSDSDLIEVGPNHSVPDGHVFLRVEGSDKHSVSLELYGDGLKLFLKAIHLAATGRELPDDEA